MRGKLRHLKTVPMVLCEYQLDIVSLCDVPIPVHIGKG